VQPDDGPLTTVGVLVGGTGVLVGVFVAVLVGVLVGGTGVLVGVSVGVLVGGTGVFVGVSVGVLVGVLVGVFVAVAVFVGVSVAVGVWVAVGVLVTVGVGRGSSPKSRMTVDLVNDALPALIVTETGRSGISSTDAVSKRLAGTFRLS
jgi:hypothetical protein